MGCGSKSRSSLRLIGVVDILEYVSEVTYVEKYFRHLNRENHAAKARRGEEIKVCVIARGRTSGDPMAEHK